MCTRCKHDVKFCNNTLTSRSTHHTAGRKNYGKMSPALVKQYESLLHSSVPKHYRKEKDPLANFEKLANVFASIVKVEVSANR